MKLETLFEIPAEKYWYFTGKNYDNDRKKVEINRCINSGTYIASEKRDGYYAKAVVNFNGEFRLESRNTSTVTGLLSEKSGNVPHLSKELRRLPKGTILIGEICYNNRKLTSKDITKIMGCKSETAVNRLKSGKYEIPIFYLHDCWYYNGEDLMEKPYEERIKYVEAIYKKFFSSNKYFASATYITDPEEIWNNLNSIYANGGEGIVLVRKDAKVEPGKRTAWKTLKVKKELSNDIDCFFTGRVKSATRTYTGKEVESWPYWENIKTLEKIQGNYYFEYSTGDTLEPVTKSYFFGMPGSLEIGVYNVFGEIVPIGYLSGLPDSMKINYKDYEMKPCKVTCMMFTEDGKLRHPKFVHLRDDIDPKDCTLEKMQSGQW